MQSKGGTHQQIGRSSFPCGLELVYVGGVVEGRQERIEGGKRCSPGACKVHCARTCCMEVGMEKSPQ